MTVWRSLCLSLWEIISPTRLQGASHLSSLKAGCLILANPTHHTGDGALRRVVARHTGEKPLLWVVHTHPLSTWQPTGMTRWLFPRLAWAWVDPSGQTGGRTIPDISQTLETHLKQGGVAVAFPAGESVASGPTPKCYGWSLLAARQANVPVMVLHSNDIPGRWVPTIWHMTVIPTDEPQDAPPFSGTSGTPPPSGTTAGPLSHHRERADQRAQDLLGEAALAHHLGHQTLWQRLCQAARQHGRGHLILTDATGKQATYGQLLTRALLLGKVCAQQTRMGAYVGILLPTSIATITTFFALQAHGRVPAMLNFTVGPGPAVSACRTARIETVYTSRLFVRKARLEPLIHAIQDHATVIFLEDLRGRIKPWHVVWGWLMAWFPAWHHHDAASSGVTPAQPAVVLFTSGSEGTPKGVVLSHDNLLANVIQILSRIDVAPEDIMLNVLPMFHAFGLTIGGLLPLFAGVRCHGVPSPLAYQTIPALAHTLRATLLAGTDTFLAGYGRAAHPCDFFRMRHVFAGAEPLRPETRNLWMRRFGIRILEGYGTTETSPVLAFNTPMAAQAGTVGRLLPGIDHRLDGVPGLEEGARLSVRGPNVMLGYLHATGEGKYRFPASPHGDTWYDSCDIVHMDDRGMLRILGRAKRFAKIGGEMVSLAAVEALATATWPGYGHAVISRQDPHKGEQLVLVTEHPNPDRKTLLEQARRQGLKGLFLPKRMLSVSALPLLGSGKVDFASLHDVVAGKDRHT